VSGLRAIAFWIFAYLSISPLLTSMLIFAGVNIPFPVFRIFESAPLLWRLAFLSSGLLAVITAYLLKEKRRFAALSALCFLALYAPSFRVVFGHISLGVWVATAATTIALIVSFNKRSEI